jgi:hypothetical protein
MGKFLEAEKERLVVYKQQTPHLSRQAKNDGFYRKRFRSYCLPRDHAAENLFVEIREDAIDYFKRYKIKWHDGLNAGPSNHLCDSQVCCVNFLHPFADKPEALAALLRPLFPTLAKMLPMEEDGRFVSFEWIGQKNYLGERIPRHGKRTRGANFTSADAAVMFVHEDGAKQIVLIEWKYTESYSKTPLMMAKSGTDRRKIYVHLYERADFPLNKKLLPSFDALFYEPFYQLFRQQLLAHEMERAQELGANVVSLMHIAPKHNTEFQRVTSPLLEPLGNSVTEIWNRLVKDKSRFVSVHPETLFGNSLCEQFPELKEWWTFITERYTWML